MLFTPAYAQTAGGLAGSAASLVQFAPLVLIAVVFYFLLIRPQQLQAKTLKTTLGAIKRGDKIVTAGGIIGTVKKVPDNATEIDVEIAPSVTVSVVRSTITKVLTPQAANDAA
jgi:preprotein translocase subunit YajC